MEQCVLAKRYPFISQKDDLKIDICAVVDLIVQTQLPDGAIPWSAGDKLDPWDHVESAIGLTIGGAFDAARKAYLWLEQHQLPGGGWHAAYKDGSVTDATRETNHAAYIAVGLYHYYLVTQDYSFLKRMWPALAAAMNFVLDLQGPGGEIYWAVSPKGQVDPMALLTGCSSICFSLKCAFVLSMLLDKPQPKWRRGYERLRDCIRTKPHRFNMTKARFSMDWFYPVLCGVFTGDEAKKRIEKHWKKFVINNLGVRCVSDQPWITIAESSELVLALNAMGDDLLARVLFGWIIDHTFSDGTFWCGFTCPDMVLWPEEKITWTNAVVLMAADALYDLTPAAGLFRHGR
ncbi:MAG: phenyltransferase domain-containing protein [Desulfobacteraceae bacterium]|nr:phenyltransferase domain-containing protein [Desulfobacteraceae bacterium]